MTEPNFRALCSELAELLGEIHLLVWGEAPHLLDEDRGGNARLDIDIEEAIKRFAEAVRSQPEPQGLKRQDIIDWLVNDRAWGTVVAPTMWRAEDDELLGLLQRAIAHFTRPAIEPVPVSERLPGPEDCVRRGDDDWCWGQERSLLTGQAAARWRLMRVSSLAEEAVTWLPHWALSMPNTRSEEN